MAAGTRSRCATCVFSDENRKKWTSQAKNSYQRSKLKTVRDDYYEIGLITKKGGGKGRN